MNICEYLSSVYTEDIMNILSGEIALKKYLQAGGSGFESRRLHQEQIKLKIILTKIS